ncbi:hypothetical protein MU852_03585 [Brevundimonas albigilva]|uniref:hypothetical protein n=1 Tax=Brevundimonas albigilva TaxID=1312364 RepID=UPI00201B5B46|nr:hypothetical protein [Brevundimonas albigilva]UQV18960.1 hypothetical protein MU852_03585 [Brevundimonas albigilva]
MALVVMASSHNHARRAERPATDQKIEAARVATITWATATMAVIIAAAIALAVALFLFIGAPAPPPQAVKMGPIELRVTTDPGQTVAVLPPGPAHPPADPFDK